MEQRRETNRLHLSGYLAGALSFSHAVNDRALFCFTLAVERNSGTVDLLPVTADAALLPETLADGDALALDGQIRAYRHYAPDGQRHVVLTAFARRIAPSAGAEHANSVKLNGRLIRRPIYRQTPAGREIADMLVSVPRAFGRMDCLPVIAWGRLSRMAAMLAPGTLLDITGRFQSRTYQKRQADGTLCPKTAYEVSASALELLTE